MIERLEGFPPDVVAVAGKGQVTRGDYEQILIPAVELALRSHRKVNVYYELGPEFVGMDPGAAWQDFKEGFRHFFRWDKMALVTDVEWIRRTINGFSVFMPGELRVFPYAERAAARTWIAGGAAKAAA
jgi:phosphoserine phosphatase